jgi:hypothetical protein
VAEDEITIAWLPLRVAAGCVAIYLRCAEEDARLRIGRKAEDGLVRARGISSDGYPVSLLRYIWRGRIDWDAGSLKPEITNAAYSLPPYEVANVELCFADLVATHLLTTTALGRARWSAAEALAWIIIGVPLEWKEWFGLPELAQHMEEAEIILGEAICDGVPAWGRPSHHARKEQIPADDFNADRIETMVIPLPSGYVALSPPEIAQSWPRGTEPPRLPDPTPMAAQVVVRVDGTVGTWPVYKAADYKGPPWSAIEVDSARLKQVRPRPLIAHAELAVTTAIKTAAIKEDDASPASEVARRKLGRPSELPPKVKEQFFAQLDRVGVPRLDHPDPKWRAKARAAEFIEDKADMARSTAFEYVAPLIEEWKKTRKSGKSGKSDN